MAEASAVFIPAEDGSLPGTEEEQRQMALEWGEFNLERYYEEFTYESLFVSIEPHVVPILLRFLSGKTMDPTEAQCVSDLKRRLGEAISHFAGNGCFCRLNTRSPKDAVDKAPEEILPMLSVELATYERPLSNAQRFMALKKVFFERMRVKSAAQAFELFGRSARTISDLRRARQLDASQYQMSLVAREFIQIHPSTEFRCFVQAGSLRAISQYHTSLFFPNLVEKKTQIEAMIRRFFDRVSELIAHDSYVLDVHCDFLHCPDDGDAVKLVELNPYGALTGSALFSAEDYSRPGGFPRDFRIRTAPVHLQLHGGWKALCDQAERSLSVSGDWASSEIRV